MSGDPNKAGIDEILSRIDGRSLLLRVLLFGLLQNGDVGVEVFPESEEVLVGG